MQSGLYQFVGKNITTFIIVLGVICLFVLLINGFKLLSKKNRIEEIVNRKNSKYYRDSVTKEIIQKEDEKSAVTPDTVRKFEMDFNKSSSFHNIISSIIPIFPLLGVLGTVASLISAVPGVNESDLNELIKYLGPALLSTFWGLISAIVLKAVDAVFPARVIDETEVLLDDFDKKMGMSELFCEAVNKE